jgi:hypothetical protein
LTRFSEHEFQERKYEQVSFSKHNPHEPIAFTDSTLSYFEPKQWIGDLPPSSQDDKIREAIENLKMDFKVEESVKSGDKIGYLFYVNNSSEFRISVKLVVNVYDKFQNILIQSENVYNKIIEKNVFKEYLSLNTFNLLGRFNCISKVYLIVNNSDILIHSFDLSFFNIY